MHVISDNDLFQRLVFDNPWWELKPNTKVQFRNPPKRSFFADFEARVTGGPDGRALVLAGPFRAGKTVMLRQAIAKLVEGGASPQSVLYVSLTTPSYTAAGIESLFEAFCRRYRHGPDSRIYIFFDELQYQKGWEETVQALLRMRPKARIVCAVSAGAPALVNGPVPDMPWLETFVLPPLTFLEFLRFRGSETKLFGPGANKPHAKAVFHEKMLPVLNQEFMRYINYGGFPEGILGKSEGAPAPTFIRDGLADRVLQKNLPGLFGIADSRELNRLLGILAFNTGREVSMDDLAKISGIAKNTLRKYLDYLEGAFLIRRVDRVDGKGQRFQRAVAFKVYLTAPCLYAALFGPQGLDAPSFERLAETAMVTQWFGTDSASDLAYGSWRGGSVDVVAYDRNTDRPDWVIQVDWDDRYSRPDKAPENLARFVEEANRKATAYILTHNVARPGRMRGIDITLIPASLYTYWLTRDRLPARGRKNAA